MNKRKFTVREGLIGVIVVSLLAAPIVFSRARENARSSSCRNNLQQIGLGIAQYTQDYDGKYPLNNNPRKGWVILITAYTKNCPILQCPSDPNPIVMTPRAPGLSDYWMNKNLFDAQAKGISKTALDRPDHTFMAGDGDSRVGTSTYTLNQAKWDDTAFYATRHLSSANYLWADGHVKSVRADVIKPDKTKDPCCTPYSFKLKVIK